MNNYSYAAVATMGINSVSAIFLLVILISSIFQKKEKRKKDKVFILMLVLDITALILNVLCNVFDGMVGLSTINYVITVIATCLCVPAAGSLVAYTIETVKEHGEIMKDQAHVWFCARTLGMQRQQTMLLTSRNPKTCL